MPTFQCSGPGRHLTTEHLHRFLVLLVFKDHILNRLPPQTRAMRAVCPRQHSWATSRAVPQILQSVYRAHNRKLNKMAPYLNHFVSPSSQQPSPGGVKMHMHNVVLAVMEGGCGCASGRGKTRVKGRHMTDDRDLG